MPKFRFTLSIGFVGGHHEDIIEIPDDEWKACVDEKAQEQLKEDYWRDWSNNYIDGGVEPIED